MYLKKRSSLNNLGQYQKQDYFQTVPMFPLKRRLNSVGTNPKDYSSFQVNKPLIQAIKPNLIQSQSKTSQNNMRFSPSIQSPLLNITPEKKNQVPYFRYSKKIPPLNFLCKDEFNQVKNTNKCFFENPNDILRNRQGYSPLKNMFFQNPIQRKIPNQNQLNNSYPNYEFPPSSLPVFSKNFITNVNKFVFQTPIKMDTQNHFPQPQNCVNSLEPPINTQVHRKKQQERLYKANVSLSKQIKAFDSICTSDSTFRKKVLELADNFSDTEKD